MAQQMEAELKLIERGLSDEESAVLDKIVSNDRSTSWEHLATDLQLTEERHLCMFLEIYLKKVIQVDVGLDIPSEEWIETNISSLKSLFAKALKLRSYREIRRIGQREHPRSMI